MISDGYFSNGTAGWIEVICGVMFSGKSEELIRRVRRAIIAKKTVQVFKSHLDERYAGIYRISSHDGRSVDAVPVDTPEQIARLVLPDTQVVAIDEAQFLDRVDRRARDGAGEPGHARHSAPAPTTISAASRSDPCRSCSRSPRSWTSCTRSA